MKLKELLEMYEKGMITDHELFYRFTLEVLQEDCEWFDYLNPDMLTKLQEWLIRRPTTNVGWSKMRTLQMGADTSLIPAGTTDMVQHRVGVEILRSHFESKDATWLQDSVPPPK